jgi:hypothetical protein
MLTSCRYYKGSDNRSPSSQQYLTLTSRGVSTEVAKVKLAKKLSLQYISVDGEKFPWN